MTEYDYSPEAIERHNAKQAHIANWVERTKQHEPANPFKPIPGEHAPSETYDPYPQPHHPSPQYSSSQYPSPQYPSSQYPSPQYPSSQYPSPQYPVPQQPYQFHQQAQPAFYATSQGVISPTYSSPAKRHHGHHHRHHNSHQHSSGSKSLRPSPQTATSALPMGMGVSYAPTPQRSLSTPPSMTAMSPNGMLVPVAMTSPNSYFGYAAQQQQLHQPLLSPPTTQMQGYPFQYLTSPPAMATAYSHSSSHTNSRPSSAHHSSHSRSYSYSQSHHDGNSLPQSPPLQSPPYGQVYQSSPNQPTVVPTQGGGYIIVPAGQSVQVLTHPQSYAYPQYGEQQYEPDSESESDRGAPSFFGSLSLKKLGASLKSGKSKRKGRRESHY